MTSLSVMKKINLGKFPKLGVRVPSALKRKILRLSVDLDEENIRFQGQEISMEAIFGVAALALLALDKTDQVKLFWKHTPELLALFESEMPGAKKDPAGDGVERHSDIEGEIHSDEVRSGVPPKTRPKRKA